MSARGAPDGPPTLGLGFQLGTEATEGQDFPGPHGQVSSAEV